MKVTIRAYGDNQLEVEGCVLNSRRSAEKLAANILAMAKRIWPDEKKEPAK